MIMSIYKRVVIELKVDGTDDQANCMADAIGEPLGEFVERILTPLSVSESCNVSWEITRHTYHGDTITGRNP